MQMADKTGCNNRQPCTCPKVDCARHGKCCECVANHKDRGNLPHCLRQTRAAHRVAKQEEKIQPLQ